MRIGEREGTECVASVTECTGLVPALDDDRDEEALRALGDVQPAKRRNKKAE